MLMSVGIDTGSMAEKFFSFSIVLSTFMKILSNLDFYNLVFLDTIS